MERVFTRPPERFGLVLAAILLAVVFQLAVPDTDVSRLVTIVLQTAVALVALYAAGAAPRVVTLAAAGGLLLCLLAAGVLLGVREVGSAAPRLTSLLLVLATPTLLGVGLVRELRREHAQVRLQTIFAGLSLYLLLGLAGGFVFAVIQDLSGESFFVESFAGSPNDFLYYSYATLTTTGYGDLAAATDLGRAASITIALLGQIYLVTVIAVLVGNFGRRR